MRRLLPCVFIFLFGAVGCATYEYDLAKPEEHARHIGRKADETIQIDPLEYRLRMVDNHLVVRIYNPTEEPIELLGAQSSVVDSKGQSHPLRGRTIAPASFIKLIFPPIRPRFEAGPSFGVGVGMHVSNDHGHHHHGHHYHDHGPRYYTLYDGNELYWDWDGESDARVTLVYRRGEEKTFRHEFVFHRKKM